MAICLKTLETIPGTVMSGWWLKNTFRSFTI